MGFVALAGLGVTTAVPAATASPRHASQPSPSVVGFWTGEQVRTSSGPVTNPTTASYDDPADRQALNASWTLLVHDHVPLYLQLRYGRDFGPVPRRVHSDAVAVVRRANRDGVPVFAWLVVPVRDGYWSYEGNYRLTATAVADWLSWSRANHLRFVEPVLDQEMSLQGTAEFESGLGGHPQKLATMMRANIDPAGQCRALDAYRALIGWAHHHGSRLGMTTLTMALDDLADSHLALQDALDIAGYPLRYDDEWAQPYRSESVQTVGVDPGAAWVATYYKEMKRYFGPRGQVTIGVGGQKPYDDINTLVDDVRMLAGLGATRIPIYSLETTVARFGIAGLRTIIAAGAQPLDSQQLAKATAPTATSVGASRFFDSLDTTAVGLTPAVTAARGRAQLPNAWPGGCPSTSRPKPTPTATATPGGSGSGKTRRHPERRHTQANGALAATGMGSLFPDLGVLLVIGGVAFARLIRHSMRTIPSAGTGWRPKTTSPRSRPTARCCARYLSPAATPRPGTPARRTCSSTGPPQPDWCGYSSDRSTDRSSVSCSPVLRAGSPLTLASGDRLRHQFGDLRLVGGSQRLERVVRRPHLTVVEVGVVGEPDGGVPRLELSGTLEEADDVAVFGVRRHPVPGFRV